jgi:hypothetical protein
MEKLPSRTILMARAQKNKYKSPFRDKRTSLFNVEAAKDPSVPHVYTRETFSTYNPKSDRIVS